MVVSSFVYQNDSKVIHISQRRSGDDRISQCLQEFMAIICIMAGPGLTPCAKAWFRVCGSMRAAAISPMTSTVRVVHESVNTGMPLSGGRQREQVFDVAATRPLALPWPQNLAHHLRRSD
jgi:hypothetical protein